MRLLILLLVTCLLLGPTSGATAEPPSPGGPATAPLVVMGWGGNAFGTLGDPTASEPAMSLASWWGRAAPDGWTR